MKKLVIALGGNALQSGKDDPTAEAQRAVVSETCKQICQIVNQGYYIALVHGNGPQVGRILLASETAKDVTPAMPFDVCGSMSQGYIGYHIQQAMQTELMHTQYPDIPVVTLVTQIVVDKNDPAFLAPSKPIGPFYSAEDATHMESRGYTMREDAGRGWRRVVPSPLPKKIAEIDSVRRLWDSTIVVACGGGGIPVIETSAQTYTGVAAVIDKDFAAELLAEETGADTLLILTEVEKVAIHFNTPQQKDLDCITAGEAEAYCAQGHFAAGSMLPKVQAAIKFARSSPGRKAIITSLYQAVDALVGKNGTCVTA